MSPSVPDLDVDGMLEVLATGAEHPLSPGVPVSQLDHALQTAALLAHLHPGDDELAAAGLVHDIGHLLPGGTDEAHAADAARAVRRALGERVAGTVGLHVDGEAVSRGDRRRVRRCAHQRQRGLAASSGRCDDTRRRRRPSWRSRGRPTP